MDANRSAGIKGTGWRCSVKQKVNTGILLATFLAGGVGMAVWFAVWDKAGYETWWQTYISESGLRALTMGTWCAVSLVSGLLGFFLAEYLQRKRFRVVRHRKRVVSLLLAAVLGMVLGAGGQVLYALSYRFEAGKLVDIVLLLDSSDSMGENRDVCKEAACEFIAQAAGTSRIQVCSFGALVTDSTELLEMDNAGKEAGKAFIRGIDTVGGTNFEYALEWAYQSLINAEDRNDRKQAVVIVTDGQAEIGDEVREQYVQAGLVLYSIQFEYSKGSSAPMDELTSFSEETGGFDIRLARGTDGKIQMSEMKQAFNDMYAGARELYQSGGYLAFGALGMNIVWRLAVRTVFFALFAILAGFVYYGRLTEPQAAANIAAGCLTAVLISLAGAFPVRNEVMFLPGMFLTDFFIVSAWTSCIPENTADAGKEI